jgi:hypothetical protein
MNDQIDSDTTYMWKNKYRMDNKFRREASNESISELCDIRTTIDKIHSLLT